MAASRIVCDMGGAGGSGTINLPNVRGWGIEAISVPDEDAAVVDLLIVFFTPGARPLLRKKITIRNGACDQLSRNASPTSLDDIITVGSVTAATAYTDLRATSGATKALREKAMADSLIANNIIAVNLRGPTS